MGLPGYHFGDYRRLQLPLLLIVVGWVPLIGFRGRSVGPLELIGRYRVDRDEGHDQRVLGTKHR